MDILDVEGISQDSLITFLNSFITENQFSTIDFQILNKKIKTEFQIDLNDFFPAWYECNKIPAYLVKPSLVYQVNTNNNKKQIRTEFSIFNDSDVDGIINIQTFSELPGGIKARKQAWQQQQRDCIVKYKSYCINAKTGKQFALVVDKGMGITINTNISKNLPNQIILTTTGFSTLDTSQYIHNVTRDFFLPDTNEIFIDNTDPGFSIIEPSFKLSDWFQSNKEKRYNFETNEILLATEKWKECISLNGYGTTIRSYLFKKATSNKYSCEWKSTIRKEGTYEAFVYIPKEPLNNYSGETDRLQRYKIITTDNQKQIININIQRPGWHSLGIFHCTPGECKILLSNKGYKGQILIADAIKWVFKQ